VLSVAVQQNLAPHPLTWHGIDLRWAYANLLPTISQQTRCLYRAQDILHDALIRFALSKNPQVHQPHAYLRQVVKSVLVDSLRDSAKFVPLFNDVSELAGNKLNNGYQTDGHVSGHVLEQTLVPSAQDIVELNQRLKALQIIVDSLPKKCRVVFWMHCVEGYTHPEIAQKLGVSLNMVERHMMRALISLRAECDEMLR